MWLRLRHLLEMIRFSHTVFAMPFAMLAAMMAWWTPTIAGVAAPFRAVDLAGIVGCLVFARSTAMAFNRLVDRDFDARNPRTARRHLPAGVLSVGAVALFTAVSAAGFVAATLAFLPNRLPLYLSIPVLLFLWGYSFTKRFTALAHVWLGAALMLAPVSAWIAIRGAEVSVRPIDLLPAVWLGTAVLLWVAGFDVIYACQDADFDRAAGLRSIPSRLGVSCALRWAAVCHVLMVAVLATLPFSGRVGGPRLALGWPYASGVVAIAVLLTYEHWLVRPNDLSRVNQAFFHVNAVVSIGLFLIGSFDLVW